MRQDYIKTIKFNCSICGKEFLNSQHYQNKRKNKPAYCSYSCSAKRTHQLYSYRGMNNPNHKTVWEKAIIKALRDITRPFDVQRQASAKLCMAVHDGKITRQNCSICGEPNAEGHHTDYSKPLEVVWLCDKHHKEQHNLG